MPPPLTRVLLNRRRREAGWECGLGPRRGAMSTGDPESRPVVRPLTWACPCGEGRAAGSLADMPEDAGGPQYPSALTHIPALWGTPLCSPNPHVLRPRLWGQRGCV